MPCSGSGVSAVQPIGTAPEHLDYLMYIRGTRGLESVAEIVAQFSTTSQEKYSCRIGAGSLAVQALDAYQCTALVFDSCNSPEQEFWGGI